VIGDYVVVSWRAPYNGGSTIFAYQVTIRQFDGLTFTEDLVGCDGTDATIVLQRQCSVSIADLTAEPYGLAWGSDIYAKVSAINVLGSSQVSL
jgi:hypothetical protein